MGKGDGSLGGMAAKLHGTGLLLRLGGDKIGVQATYGLVQ